MLETLFLQILNMSFIAGITVLFVLLARLLLKKAPKIFSYLLWSVVLFRLVCPFSFESIVSLLPVNANPIPKDIAYSNMPVTGTGVTAVNESINAALPTATSSASINPSISLGASLWLLGVAVLLIYSVISFIKLKNRLKNAAYEKENIYTSAGLTSPFVMGIFHPKIYLPENLSHDQKQYIILHEQTHVKRFDHVIKLFSFFVLCVHWFNPLVWAAFFMSAKDMEMSCDEAVIKKLGAEVKKDYSSSLLTLATGKRTVGGSPLAFGEGDTKSRIKNVLSYKKPAFWVTVISIIAVAAVGLVLAANPAKDPVVINSLYTPALTPAREVELAQEYKFPIGSTMFQTQIHVDDSIKSCRYYVDVYRQGEFLGTIADSYGNFNDKNGAITTAYSINTGEDGGWEGLRLGYSFLDGGSASNASIPFPEGFSPFGVYMTAVAGKKDSAPVEITPEVPVIIGLVAFQMDRKGGISNYSCEYLMENPEAIAEYECVYLAKCMFSQKDGNELVKDIPLYTENKVTAATETPIDAEKFLAEISRSFEVKDGTARFTVPSKMPEGYDVSQLSVRVTGSMPMGDDGSNMLLHVYEK